MVVKSVYEQPLCARTALQIMTRSKAALPTAAARPSACRRLQAGTRNLNHVRLLFKRFSANLPNLLLGKQASVLHFVEQCFIPLVAFPSPNSGEQMRCGRGRIFDSSSMNG
jgi:hypothetical protein